MMNCPECGNENREDARFCRNCGNLLGDTCPACDHALPADAHHPHPPDAHAAVEAVAV